MNDEARTKDERPTIIQITPVHPPGRLRSTLQRTINLLGGLLNGGGVGRLRLPTPHFFATGPGPRHYNRACATINGLSLLAPEAERRVPLIQRSPQHRD